MKWKTNKYLKELYKTYNRRYFKSSLPEISIKWKQPKSRNRAAEFYVYENESLEILINPVLRKNNMQLFTMQTLLHEMCHVKLRKRDKSIAEGHGDIFQKEMKRLAKIGAFKNLW